MSLLASLTSAIAQPIATQLLKSYVGDTTASVGDSLLTVATRHFADHLIQRDAQRQFEALADRVIRQLLPIFEEESDATGINLEAIALELGRSIAPSANAHFLITADLDPVKATATIRGSRPLPAARSGSLKPGP
jgi:hypothetical protein